MPPMPLVLNAAAFKCRRFLMPPLLNAAAF
jgi:hypothetical protein